MANYSAKILNNATGALAAQQAVIAAASNNIANANTPGYSRRVVELQTRASGGEGVGVNVGNGVEVGRLARLTDTFLEKLVRDTTADKNYYGVQNDLLQRVDALFSVTGDKPTIGSAMTAFFASVNDLAANPSSIPLRSTMIDRGNDLVSAIRTTFQTIADIQNEADGRIATEIQGVNSLTQQIGSLNDRIRANERTGNTDADSRDQRDVLMQRLSEKIGYSTVELPDGTVTLSLSNGFVLVSGGDARQLQTTPNPSFSPGSLPPALNGGILSYIVYDYSGGAGAPAHVDLSRVIGGGGGTLGGLMAVRGYNDPNNTSAFDADGVLVGVASRVESIARQLLTTINQSYLGPDNDPGTAGHQPSAGDLDGHTADFYNATDHAYNLFSFDFNGTKDADGDGLPNDLNALGVDSFARVLQFGVSDPRRIAAALNAGSLGSPVYAPGDGRNLENLAGFETNSTMNFSVGSYSMTGTFGETYAESVGYVGNSVGSVKTQLDVTTDNLTTALNHRDEVSGVSLDEEFTSLIKFQKAYQASAKLIKVADDLLTQIVNIL